MDNTQDFQAERSGTSIRRVPPGVNRFLSIWDPKGENCLSYRLPMWPSTRCSHAVLSASGVPPSGGTPPFHAPCHNESRTNSASRSARINYVAYFLVLSAFKRYFSAVSNTSERPNRWSVPIQPFKNLSSNNQRQDISQNSRKAKHPSAPEMDSSLLDTSLLANDWYHVQKFEDSVVPLQGDTRNASYN